MKGMSIQLFRGLRGDLSVILFPHNRGEAHAYEPIGAASSFFRGFFQLKQERVTKSYETARIKPVLLRVISWINLVGERRVLKIRHYPDAQSKVLCTYWRHPVMALCCLAVLICLSSIAGAQRLRIEIRVLPNTNGRVIVQGSGAPAAAWSFPDSYAGILNLGSRIEGLRLYDAAGIEVPIRKIAPGQFQAEAPATRFHYEAKLVAPARASDASRVSWLSSERGLLMLRDLLPSTPSPGTANKQVGQGVTVRLSLPPGWVAHANTAQNAGGEFELADADLGVFAVGDRLRISTTKIAGMTFSLVAASEWDFSDAEALELAIKDLKAHTDVFGAAPSRQATLILFPFPQSGVADKWSAETRGSSVTLLAGRLPSKVGALAELIVLLTYELLHFWVPNALALTGDYDWFYEGFTVYQAARISVRLDLLTFQEFLNAIGRAYDGYSLALDHDHWSLIEASKRRFTTGESSVYSKSMVVAFLYDLNLRSLSRNKHSLDEVYRNLFREYRNEEASVRGGRSQTVPGNDGNAAALQALGGYSGMQNFGRSFVSNAAAINLTELLAPFGL